MFIIYQLELLDPHSSTMLKLLIILFVIKLYAQMNIFRQKNTFFISNSTVHGPFYKVKNLRLIPNSKTVIAVKMKIITVQIPSYYIYIYIYIYICMYIYILYIYIIYIYIHRERERERKRESISMHIVKIAK